MFRKKILSPLLTLLSLISSTGFAQSFQYYIPSEPTHLLVTGQGEIGISNTAGAFHLFDSLMNRKWSLRIASSPYSPILSTAESPARNFFLSAMSEGFPSLSQRVGVIMKTDSVGIIQWQKCIFDSINSNLYPSGSIALPNEELLVYGSFNYYNGFICKFDSSGNMTWMKRIGQGAFLKGVQTRDNHYLFGSSNNYLFKLDVNGNLLWSKSFNSTLSFSNLLESPTGKINLLLGDFTSSGSFALLQLDSLGDPLWGKTYVSTELLKPVDLAFLSDSSLILLINFTPTTGGGSSLGYNLFLHTDTAGLPISAISIGISNHDNIGVNITSTSNGFIALGLEPFDDTGSLIKVDELDSISCGAHEWISVNPFSIQLDTFSISISNEGIDTNCVVAISYQTNLPVYPRCGTTMIRKMFDFDEINVYPNPFSKNLFIDTKTSVETVTNILLTNTVGKTILELPVKDLSDGHLTIKTEDLSPGVYFLLLNSKRNTICKMLIKQ